MQQFFLKKLPNINFFHNTVSLKECTYFSELSVNSSVNAKSLGALPLKTCEVQTLKVWITNIASAHLTV